MAVSAQAIERYALLDDASCEERILAARETLGDSTAILGHHYQREEVYRHADYTGDSLRLARHAANVDAKYIVFCGVHFMAEVADILSRPEQVVILPDLAAGCAMADMADLNNVERAWKELGDVIDVEASLTPVTYVNSAANLKAFCGRHGGLVCTSSNAQDVIGASLQQRDKLLFFPDQHLGRYTGYRMGIPLEEMVVWDYDLPMGGLEPQQIHDARIILWKGFCSVHQMFQVEHIDRFLANHPDAQVICHPECSFEVVKRAEFVGSTEFIQQTIRNAVKGTRWLVGTELNLVNRLHNEVKDRGINVHFMSPMVCMCSTMFRIDPQHLAWTLENLATGNVVNRIRVSARDAEQARVALQRMLEVTR